LLPRATVELPLKSGPLRALVGRLGLPPAALDHADFTCTIEATRTTEALGGSGIAVPPVADYAPVLWRY
jgi:hypothetical protein